MLDKLRNLVSSLRTGGREPGPTVLVAGDSLCCGASGQGYGPQLQKLQAARMNVVLPADGPQTAAELADRLPDWLAGGAEAAVIGTGLGDALCEAPPSPQEYGDCLDRIAAALEKADVEAVYWLYAPHLPPRQAGEGGEMNARLDEYNEILRQVINEHDAFTGIFLAQKFERWGIEECFRGDGPQPQLSERAAVGVARAVTKGLDHWQALHSAGPLYCNICKPEYHQAVLDGRGHELDVPVHYEKCPHCGTPSRIRTFATVFDREIRPRVADGRIAPDSALTFAAVGETTSRIGEVFEHLTSAALYGNYGSRTARLDIASMPEVPDGSHTYVHACYVLDYVPAVEDALRECYRVLRAPGAFLFHIAPQRLGEDDNPPRIKHYEACRKATYYPKGHKIPSMRIGTEWLMETLAEIGFRPHRFDVPDPFSGQDVPWFLGCRQ